MKLTGGQLWPGVIQLKEDEGKQWVNFLSIFFPSLLHFIMAHLLPKHDTKSTTCQKEMNYNLPQRWLQHGINDKKDGGSEQEISPSTWLDPRRTRLVGKHTEYNTHIQTRLQSRKVKFKMKSVRRYCAQVFPSVLGPTSPCENLALSIQCFEVGFLGDISVF